MAPQAAANVPRPKFEPRKLDDDSPTEPLREAGTGNEANLWKPLIACSADFPIEIFEIAITQLIHHPEYNSTLILRSEVLRDERRDFPTAVPTFDGLSLIRCIHRRLLPRRPGRDAGLEQYCSLYSSTSPAGTPTADEEEEDFDDGHTSTIDTLVLTPIATAGSPLPYYHPQVSHLVFRYIDSGGAPPQLQVEVVPLPGTPTDPNSRLYRTCLALLETVHRYGWGSLANYKKRVIHDCLVPREEYQDLYLVMRERHKHLVDTWQEVTDPLKHVFEDIGIATFLMLLWKDTYRDSVSLDSSASLVSEPWKTWPRPPGGFVDLGCGNGLLTHILTAEGYNGVGLDVRARTSWQHYPEQSQKNLHVHAFDPLSLDSSSSSASPYFKPGAFIIGNHADELTPWVPVAAIATSASGYLSIPCCAWSFDAKFQRTLTVPYPHPPDFVDKLNLGGDGSNASSYSMYRIWLASLSLYCGWEVESETLRIPSTRNWAVVGRRRLPSVSDEVARERVGDIIEEVRTRGVFRPRKPEGKAGDH